MGGRRILSDAQLDDMADWREAGMTYAAIASRFIAAGTPVTASTIAWQCLRLGVISPRYTQASVGRPASIGRPFTADEDAQMLALAAQGLSRAAIGRALGRRANSIAGRLYTLARIETVAEECPPVAPPERRNEARKRHRARRQLEQARAKVARLERSCANAF